MADPVFTYLPAPHEGLDLSLAPHQLPPTRAWDLANFLVHEEARIPMRGGLQSGGKFAGFDSAGVALAADTKYWTGAFPAVLEDGVVQAAISQDAANADRWWSWRVFDPAAPAAPVGEPIHGESQYWKPGITGGFVTGGFGSIPGPNWAPLQGKSFGYGWVRNQGTVSATRPMYVTYLGKRHPIRDLFVIGPRITDALGAPTGSKFWGVPRAGQAVASYGERLWVGGAVSPAGDGGGGTTSDTIDGSGGLSNKVLEPNALFFTNIGYDPMTGALQGAAAATSPISSWSTLGVVNKIVVGQETTTDRIVALASAGRYLVILKRYSVWVLTGTGTDTFSVRQISSTHGIVDPRAYAVVDDVVYFLTERGLMRFDGAELRVVSQRVNLDLIPALAADASPTAPNNGFAAVHRLGEGYIMVQVGRMALKASDTESQSFAALFHVPTERWVYFTTSATPAGNLPFAAVIAGRSWVWGRDGLVLLTDPVTNPYSVAMPSNLRGQDQSHDGTNILYYPIAPRAKLAPLRATSPRLRAQMSRFGVEFYLQKVSADTAQRFRVRLKRYLQQTGNEASAADQIGTDLTLTAEISAALTLNQRSRAQWKDQRSEFTDLYVELDRDTSGGGTSTAPTELVTRAELLGALLEVQAPTHRKTG